MVDILKVNVNLQIPSVPVGSMKCFDKETMIPMQNGKYKKISEIVSGDLLHNNDMVTAIIKVVAKGSKMYNLNDIVVSDSHIVYYNNKWIPVSQHPSAIWIDTYNEPYLYCLNTSSKKIEINGQIFTDWDEIYDNYIHEVKNKSPIKINELKDIHTYLDGGFDSETVIKLKSGVCRKIKDIKIGDILEKGEKVYGLVEIDGNTTKQFIFNLGKNIPIVGGPNLNMCDIKINETTTLSLDENNKFVKNIVSDKLYHLLTDKKTFVVEDIKFYDYNACIDLFLDKYRGKLLSMKYV